MDNDFGRIQRQVLTFVSRLIARLGYEDVTAKIGLLEELMRLQIFSLFLGLIVSIVMTSLAGLLTLLIYSLLIVSVETRAFDLGVMRMVGMTRGGVVRLLITQTFFYSLPAWVFGLIAAQFLATYLLNEVGRITNTVISPILQPESVLWATIMGLLVPVGAAILPIRKALGSNLNDALDGNRSKVSAIQVTIERSAVGGPPAFLVTAGLILSCFGFLVYYLFPRALLELNLSLLLYIFFGLLGGMLLGLTLLSLNLERSVEHLVAYTLLFWNGASVRTMMFKNLIAHRVRNRKTTIMYSLSLAFIIFIIVTFSLQIITFQYQEKRRRGTLLRFYCPQWSNSLSIFGEVNALVEQDDRIIDVGYVSHGLDTVVGANTRISTLGKVDSAPQIVYAVSPNFFQVTLPDFLVINEMDATSGYPLDEQLYSPRGSQSMILGSLYKKSLSLNMNSTLLLEVQKRVSGRDIDPNAPPSNSWFTRLRPLAFLDGSAAVSLSQYPERERQDALVSLPTFMRLSQGIIKSIGEVPIRLYLFQIDEATADDATLDAIKYKLRQIAGRYGCNVDDVRQRNAALKTALEAMDFFAGATTTIAMIVSFFSLTSSMYANIHEQAKEMGMLRAIGVRRPWIQRVYTLEAFTLVMSATLLGLMIGTVVAVTVTAQRAIFTQLPVPFSFPWKVLGWVVPASFASAVAASFIPATRMVYGKNIASLMRQFG